MQIDRGFIAKGFVAVFSFGACLWLLPSTAMASVIIVPPSLEDTQGGFGGVTPFAFAGIGGRTTGIRTQIAYDASLFGALTEPQIISAIQFRPIDPAGGIFGDTLSISDVRLQLSTTQGSDESGNTLSSTFADNIGPDATTVFTGPLTLTTSSTLLPNGTRAFDYVIPLQNPFIYDPSQGNLLLDTLVPTGETIQGNSFFGAYPRFDTANSPNDGIFSVINVNSGSATTGLMATSGPVTAFQVTAVPEPSSCVLVVFGAMTGLVLATRRKRRAASKSCHDIQRLTIQP